MPTDYWGRISKENDKSFEEVRDQLYFEHHYHPTNIPHYSTSKSEDARTAENDAQAAQLAKQGNGRAWVNGLPGPVSSESYVISGSEIHKSSAMGCIWFVVIVSVITMIIMVAFAIAANIGGL